IHPERGAPRAAPAVLAGRARHRVEARLLADGEAEAETVSRRERGGRHPDVADMTRGDVRDGGAAQEADAIELPAVQEHLREARVVRRRPRRSGATRLVLL